MVMGMKRCIDCGEQRSDQIKSACPNCGSVEKGDFWDSWFGKFIKVVVFVVVAVGLVEQCKGII